MQGKNNSTHGKLDILEVGQSTTYRLSDYYALGSAIEFRRKRYARTYSRKTEGDRVRVTRTR